MNRRKGKDPLEEKMFCFLDRLRDSGACNMFGSAPFLAEEFNLTMQEARRVLSAWIRSWGVSE